MIIGSVCENKASEKRISVTPENVKKFVSNGFKVYLEKSYGTHLDIDDQSFSEASVNRFRELVIKILSISSTSQLETIINKFRDYAEDFKEVSE